MRLLDTWVARAGWALIILGAIYFTASVALR